MASASRRRTWQIQSSWSRTLIGPPVVSQDGLRERLPCLRRPSALVQGHRENEPRGRAEHAGCVPSHQGDRPVELTLAVFRQALDELEEGVVPLSSSLCRRPRRARREGDDLAQFLSRRGPEQTGPSGPFRDDRVGRRAELREQGPAGVQIILLLPEEQAEFGVPVPRVVFRRVFVERLAPGDPCLIRSSLSHQEGAQFSLREPGFRIDRDGLSVLGEGLALLVVALQDLAGEGVEYGRPGIEAEGRRELSNGLVLAAQVPQSGDEVLAGDDAPRGRGRRPAESARSPRPAGLHGRARRRDCCGPWPPPGRMASAAW